MDGRRFLKPAQLLAGQSGEEYWRAAAGRAYYALFLECRETLLRWGFVIPRRENVHTFVRLRFTRNTDVNVRTVGQAVEDLSNLRNEADYQVASSGKFVNDNAAQRALQKAQEAITLLDQINADPVQQAAAIAALRQAWP